MRDSLFHSKFTYSHFREPRPFVTMDSNRLWQIARNEKILLVLREPHLTELALRKDTRILPYCSILLDRGGFDEWYLAIYLLSILATDKAIQKLLMLYAFSDRSDRKLIIRMLSQIIRKGNSRNTLKCISKHEILHIDKWKEVVTNFLIELCSELGISFSMFPELTSSKLEEDSMYSRKPTQNY